MDREKEYVTLKSFLQVRLEVTDQRAGYYILSFDTFHYPITLNLEAVTLNDWLRRLRAVLVGKNDPSGELTPKVLLRNVGIWLWRALLPESASTQGQDTLTHALRTGYSPLLLALPPILAGLPWELLCDPEQSDERGFLASRRSVIRLSASTTMQAPIELPLRVLLLISSPLSLGEDSRVDVESERSAIEQTTHKARVEGKLHLHVEDIVTIQRVENALINFRPHIVHYIGHGIYNATTGGALLWEDEQGNELFISDRHLAEIFSHRNLRAVVLHGCETGRSNARMDVHSLAGTLANAGIPVVLAQQANFTYTSSQHASEAWYTALTAEQGFAEALLIMRQALIQAERPDWAVPILQGSITSFMPMLTTSSLPGLADPLITDQETATNLPTPAGIFVGRHRELRALCLMLENLSDSGPVMALITGPGGVGKSTLVAQAVIRYGRIYKATLTLRCQDYHSADLFLQQIGEFLKQLGMPIFWEQTLSDPTLSTKTKIDQAIVALNATGPVLLVIDNLETVQNSDQTLRDEALLLFLQKLLINLHSGRVLITGRYAVKDLLPSGNRAIPLLHLELGDLSTYETNQLLIHHPTLAQLSELVREKIVLEFGGLPYIYDLLSSKAAEGELDHILYEIRKYGTEEQKQPTKQQKRQEEWKKVHHGVMEFATLEVIFNRLSEASQTLLAQLAVLFRPFPLAAIEQGLGASHTAWQPLLNWSLLHYDPHEKAYRLHGLTRRYAEDFLEDQARKQIQMQLATWYEQYALQDSYDLADWLEGHRLLRAAGNIQQAGKLVMQVAGRLRQIGQYPLLQELCAEVQEDIQDTDEPLKANVLYELGIQAHLQGKNGEAQDFYQRSLEINERLGNKNEQAKILYVFGNLAYSQAKLKEAQRFYQQSLDLSNLPASQPERVSILHALGLVAQQQGKYEEARRFYQQSSDLFEELGLVDQSIQAKTQFQLGKIAQEQGKYAEAQRLYQESLAVYERLGDQSGRLMTLQQLGTIAYSRGKHEEARDLYEQSLAIDEQLGGSIWRAVILHQLGMIAQDQGEYEEARLLYQQALDLSDRLEDRSGKAGAIHQLGLLAMLQGKYEEAQQLTQQGLEIFKYIGEQSRYIISLQQLGTIAYLQQKYKEAQNLYQQSLDICIPAGNQREYGNGLHMLSLIAHQQGKREEAHSLSSQSLEIFNQLGEPRGQANCLQELAALAHEQEDFEKSVAYMVQISHLFDFLDFPTRALVLENITRLRNTIGNTRFTTYWHTVAGDYPLPVLPAEDPKQQLQQVVIEFIDAPTWDMSKSILTSHPELLQPETDALLQSLALEIEEEHVRKVMEEHRLLLALCVEKGIDAAFAAQVGRQFIMSLLGRLPRWKRKGEKKT